MGKLIKKKEMELEIHYIITSFLLLLLLTIFHRFPLPSFPLSSSVTYSGKQFVYITNSSSHFILFHLSLPTYLFYYLFFPYFSTSPFPFSPFILLLLSLFPLQSFILLLFFYSPFFFLPSFPTFLCPFTVFLLFSSLPPSFFPSYPLPLSLSPFSSLSYQRVLTNPILSLPLSSLSPSLTNES